jgi:two-component system phosphate regulon sensor histidine kinase PhoR
MATPVRRLILINVIIFAVLAATVALAYYGYSFAAVAAARERTIIQDTMRELAEEKVIGIETQLIDADQKVFESIQLEPLSDLGAVVATHAAAVVSVFVLDAAQRVVPGGYAGRAGEEGVRFGELFAREIVPRLDLPGRPYDQRGHLHARFDGRDFLFSFSRRSWAGRDYYVVLEHDLSHLVGERFQKFFSLQPQQSPRLYQVIDEFGELVFGVPLRDVSGGVVVEYPFAETVDRWTLRVAQKDAAQVLARGRRRVIDFVLIGVALAVIVAGLAVLVTAMGRERRANELKSEFISNVSHELKTPLSIISMFGEMLAQGRTKSPSQATEYAEIIWRESVRLARLIDNVLDFAKIERGVDVYEFADTDVAEVVRRALELSVHRLQKADMVVTSTLADDLPEVPLDGNAYTLAVLNLIDNAIKYAPDGKKIEVTLGREGERLVLSVRDWGPGIDPEEQDRIFERFYRARAVRLKPIRGSGIGLALVQHIAEAHGGSAEVRSTPGQGATFRLVVPITRTGAPRAAARDA